MKRLLTFTLPLLLFAISVPQAANASIIGDTVTSSVVPTSLWSSSPTSAVVGAGAEFQLLLISTPFFSIDVDGTGFNFDFISTGGLGAGAGEIYTLGDIDFVGMPGAVISGVNVTIFGNPGGISASDVTFTNDSVSFDFDGGSLWSANQGQGIRVDLLWSNNVPEPGTIAIWSVLGLAGVMVRRRKIT